MASDIMSQGFIKVKSSNVCVRTHVCVMCHCVISDSVWIYEWVYSQYPVLNSDVQLP